MTETSDVNPGLDRQSAVDPKPSMPAEPSYSPERPFDPSPQPTLFFPTAGARAALEDFRVGVRERRGLMLLVGEAGTGKSTLLLKLKRQLEDDGCLVILPQGEARSFDDLLAACCADARVADGVEDRMGRVHALTATLIERLEAGNTAAVLLDDADRLPGEVLEDFGRLTAIEKGGHKLVQIVITGLPDLVGRLCGSDHDPIQICAIAHRRLERLADHEIDGFIQHQLRSADPAGACIFDHEAITRIARISDGLPRRINEICAACLRMIDAETNAVISAATVDAAAQGTTVAPQAPDAIESPFGAAETAETLAADTFREDPAIPAWLGARPTAEPNEDERAPVEPLEVDHPIRDRADIEAAAPDMQAEATDPELVHNEGQADAATRPLPTRLVAMAADAWRVRSLPKRSPWVFGLMAGLMLGGVALWRSHDVLLDWLIFGGEDIPASETADAGGAEDNAAAADTLDAATTTTASRRSAPLNGAGDAVLEVSDATGVEDRAIRLGIEIAPIDSEIAEKLSVTISDMPEGALLLSGIDNGDGSWTLSHEILDNATLIPPLDFSGRFQLTVSASMLGADANDPLAALPLNVRLQGAADLPSLEVTDAAGQGGRGVPLTIHASLTDTDDSERLSIALEGLPEGARLSAGQDLGGGVWRLEPRQVPGVELLPPADFGGRTQVMVSATAHESDGDQATTTLPLDVTIAGTGKDASADKSGFVLQLASFRTAKGANKELARLEELFDDILDGSKLSVQKAETQGHAYYRVRTETVPGKAEALDLCARLKANQQDCLVYRRRPAGKANSFEQVVFQPVARAAEAPSKTAGEPELGIAPDQIAANVIGSIGIAEFVVARDVIKREPVEVTDTFSREDTDAYAFASIANSGPPTNISFVWRYGDTVYAAVEMEIGTSPRWRTWSSAELLPGRWRVQLVTSDGVVLGEQPFTVQ